MVVLESFHGNERELRARKPFWTATALHTTPPLGQMLCWTQLQFIVHLCSFEAMFLFDHAGQDLKTFFPRDIRLMVLKSVKDLLLWFTLPVWDILELFSQAIRHYLWAATPRMISLSQVIGACDKGLQWLMALQLLRRMTETPVFGVCHSLSFDLQDWAHEVSICWMVAQTWILVCQHPLRARIGVDSADVQLHVSLVCSQRIQLQHDRISFYTASWLEPSASDLPQDDHYPRDILICFVIFTQKPNWGILRNDKFAVRTNPFFWLVMVCGHLATLPHLGHSCLWKLWQLA